jgi:L-asparaginase
MKTKILVIYTGGTIGMIKDPETAQLKSVDFNLIYDHVPELKRLNVELTTKSFEKPIDSSEINIENWKSMASMIEENYNLFDGFVILHGSDTMAYSSSALSFMFDGLKKPIIFTGSQLPIGTIRTDGKENLITAIEIAAARNDNNEALIQEVAVYFDYKLFRGNRCTKVSAEHFEAFKSPNYSELASAGVHIIYNNQKFYHSSKCDLSVNYDLNTNVALLKLYPGIDFNLYKGLFDFNHCKAVIIESFGAGNSPSSATFKTLLENYIAAGGIVFNITQCNSGRVKQGMYATSSMFEKSGVISGIDMTTEAAVTKLMAVINSDNPKEQLRANLRGEVTI